jgi:hypothetical protein
VLVSLEYPLRRYQARDELAIGIWVINDLHDDLPGCQLEVRLQAGSGEVIAKSLLDLDIVADSASEVGSTRWTLPPGDGWLLTCELLREGQILSANDYDLTVRDDTKPTLSQRLWSWLSGLVVPS